MAAACCTATSSPRTSWSTRTGASWSSTSASRAPSNPARVRPCPGRCSAAWGPWLPSSSRATPTRSTCGPTSTPSEQCSTSSPAAGRRSRPAARRQSTSPAGFARSTRPLRPASDPACLRSSTGSAGVRSRRTPRVATARPPSSGRRSLGWSPGTPSRPRHRAGCTAGGSGRRATPWPRPCWPCSRSPSWPDRLPPEPAWCVRCVRSGARRSGWPRFARRPRTGASSASSSSRSCWRRPPRSTARTRA